MNFIIGSLFPKDSDGKANIQLSSRFEQVKTDNGEIIIREKDDNDKTKRHQLKSNLDITSKPVTITNASGFVNSWFKDGITSIYDEDGNLDSSSIFGGVYSRIKSKWTKQPINRSLKSLVMLG